MGEMSVREDFLGEESLGEEYTGEMSVQEEFLGEESLGEKYMGERFVQEEFLGEKSLGENRGRWDAGFRSPLLRLLQKYLRFLVGSQD